MKKKLREYFRQWDEGNFDLSNAAQDEPDLQKMREKESADTAEWKNAPVESAAETEIRAYRKVFPVFTWILLLSVIYFLMRTVLALPAFNSADTPANSSETVRRYVESGLTETGAVNIVAGVILDYRAFDTLGESHVLFTATIAVMVLLLLDKAEEEPEEELAILENDLILRNTARISVPLLSLFGVYIILNGHLGPGGGFSGGAVIGGALILYSASGGRKKLQTVLNMKSYRIIVLSALGFYSVMKCYSFFCGANGLETIFGPGTPGRILSAGLILPLNVAVGLVVACTMYGFYAIFTRGRI